LPLAGAPLTRGRRSRARGDLALLVLLILALGFAGTFLHAGLAGERATGQGTREGRALAGRLGLTDLALFTEARYTRHPTQADRHAAFQDHPGALEHFPSGSLIPPPPAVDRSAHDPLAPETEVSD
jgi:hypothetical protein